MPITKPIGLVKADALLPFVEVLRKGGANVGRYLESARLPEELLFTPSAWIPKFQMYQFFSSAADGEDLPELGLLASAELTMHQFGSFGDSVCRAPTLLDACQTFGNLVATMTEGNQAGVSSTGETAWLMFQTLDHSRGDRSHADHYGLMMLIAVVRLVAGNGWMPSRVQTQTINPDAFERTTAWRDVNILEGMPTTAVAFPADWLSRTLPLYASSHPRPPKDVPESLPVSLSRILDTWLDQKQVLSEAEVAAVLGSSERSFKRRLAEEGVGYRQLLDRARYRKAIERLGDPGASLKEIAMELGYSGTNNFGRAFKRVSGLAPGEWRKRQA